MGVGPFSGCRRGLLIELYRGEFRSRVGAATGWTGVRVMVQVRLGFYGPRLPYPTSRDFLIDLSLSSVQWVFFFFFFFFFNFRSLQRKRSERFLSPLCSRRFFF